MTSTLNVDKIMNVSGDQDSGVDLQTNDQVKLKTANTDRITVTDATTTVANALAVDTIKNTSGVSMLTANAQGFLTQGKRLAFLATKTNNQTIAHGSHQLVQFNATEINDESAFTTGSSAKFTVPTGGAGLYWIHTHYRYETGNAFTVGSFLYYTPSGGTESSIASTYNNNVYYTGIDITFLKVLAVGDQLQMKVSQGSGSNKTIGNNDAGPTVRFIGYRIG
tara:strand:- start:529 stop:1194 length:666 start_codon:yes stop_codon:yes gene_type:complete